jgi:2-dehydropantoate 2-reductase
MDMDAETITIVGAGGIGCALGHALRTGGVDVIFVETDTAKLEWGFRNGLSVDQQPPLSATFVHFNKWHPSSHDLILLCTKCYDNRAVLERVPSSVALIPIQNGFDAELAERVTVEGIASFVTECIPGRTHTRITRPGELHIGFSGAANGRLLPPRTEALIGLLERHGSFTVVRVPEVLPYKYTKLMYNAAISPIAAVAGFDDLFHRPPSKLLVTVHGAEGAAVVGTTDGRLDDQGPRLGRRPVHRALVSHGKILSWNRFV